MSQQLMNRAIFASGRITITSFVRGIHVSPRNMVIAVSLYIYIAIVICHNSSNVDDWCKTNFYLINIMSIGFNSSFSFLWVRLVTKSLQWICTKIHLQIRWIWWKKEPVKRLLFLLFLVLLLQDVPRWDINCIFFSH